MKERLVRAISQQAALATDLGSGWEKHSAFLMQCFLMFHPTTHKFHKNKSIKCLFEEKRTDCYRL